MRTVARVMKCGRGDLTTGVGKEMKWRWNSEDGRSCNHIARVSGAAAMSADHAVISSLHHDREE